MARATGCWDWRHWCRSVLRCPTTSSRSNTPAAALNGGTTSSMACPIRSCKMASSRYGIAPAWESNSIRSGRSHTSRQKTKPSSVDQKECEMLEQFPRYPLTFGPTPIEHLARLSKHLGGGVEIYTKREDCNSGLAFGGNKLRKLEYIVPDAIASNADTLVSIGGVQSNHTRMVAAVAAKIGMKCVVIQESWVP